MTSKSLNQTRWSCRYDAVKALKMGYNDILNILKSFSEAGKEKAEYRREAECIFKNLSKLETGIDNILGGNSTEI